MSELQNFAPSFPAFPASCLPSPCASPGAWKGLDARRPVIFLDHRAVDRMIHALLPAAAAWRPEAVVGIARGGIVPASIAAGALGLPLLLLQRQRHDTARVAWLGDAPAARRLLVVDDACSTGGTLSDVRAKLCKDGYEVVTLTVVHDPEVSRFVPDLSHPMRELWRFPWERGEATPAARERRAQGQWPSPLDEAPFTAFDLDGVFVPDLPQADYDADLARTLRRRDELQPFARQPAVQRGRAIIVTGRPESDRARTEAWLSRWQLELPLVMRPVSIAPDAASVARYKAQAAQRHGCTHFVESDAAQSIGIAAASPALVVHWWDAAFGRSFVVGASAVSSPGR